MVDDVMYVCGVGMANLQNISGCNLMASDLVNAHRNCSFGNNMNCLDLCCLLLSRWCRGVPPQHKLEWLRKTCSKSAVHFIAQLPFSTRYPSKRPPCSDLFKNQTRSVRWQSKRRWFHSFYMSDNKNILVQQSEQNEKKRDCLPC